MDLSDQIVAFEFQPSAHRPTSLARERFPSPEPVSGPLQPRHLFTANAVYACLFTSVADA
jgi:hypothetical protein